MLRDLRDPIALGRKYLHLRAGGMKIEDAVHVPAEDFAHNQSVGTETVEKYRLEMCASAAAGDASAGEVCRRNAWAYEMTYEDSRVVDAPEINAHDLTGLEVRACRKVGIVHGPHPWSLVPQPGAKASVELFACPGLTPLEWEG